MIKIVLKGSFAKTDRFLSTMQRENISRVLNVSGQAGVSALSSATPVDSGQTAGSWGYETRVTARSVRLIWTNSHVEKGVPIAIILQYGHGTGTGGYVQGRDYINPALRPIFDRISDDVWKAVTSA